MRSLFRGKKIYDLLFYIYFKTKYENMEPSISELGRKAGYFTPSGGPRLALDKLISDGLIEESAGRVLITNKGIEFVRKFIIPFDFVKLAAGIFITLGVFLIMVSVAVWNGFISFASYLFITGICVFICGLIFAFFPRVYYWNLKNKEI